MLSLTSASGIERDLGLVGFQFNIALTIFYIIYILFDVPSNLALKHFGPIWIAIMVIAFGLVTIGAAFIHNYGQLITTRVLLGIAESGTLVCHQFHTTVMKLTAK